MSRGLGVPAQSPAAGKGLESALNLVDDAEDSENTSPWRVYTMDGAANNGEDGAIGVRAD